MASKQMQFSFAVIAVMAFMTVRPASATVFFAFDEWGKGFACDDGTGNVAPGITFCSYNSTTQMGSFSRIASGFSDDPTAGGGTHVLTYLLPFTLGNEDVFMRAADDTGPTDLIRLIAGAGTTTVLFYSLQEGGAGDCSRMNPPATGCDGLADVATIPNARPNLSTTIAELGPEGNNDGVLYLGGGPSNLVALIAHSDELTVCPAIPNCGPLNIAPPINNPFRDITGLGAGVGLVNLPADNPFDPIPGPTPEPGSVWLLAAGAVSLGIWKAGRRPHFGVQK